MLKLFFVKGFGPSCPSDASVIDITSEMKSKILDYHNKYRNQQALGQTPNYEPAVRMATMKWDSDLAKLAEMNVRTCIFGHDNCMNTGKMRKCDYLYALIYLALLSI